MAPKTLDEDFRFIMTCIKHSPPAAKPNFDEVAKELGAKSGNACYHRHWAIMKRWGLAGGGVGRARKAAGGAGATTLPAATAGAGKRKPRPTKTMLDSTARHDSSSETGGIGSDDANPSPPAKRVRVARPKKTPATTIKAEDESDDDDRVRIEKCEVETTTIKTEEGTRVMAMGTQVKQESHDGE